MGEILYNGVRADFLRKRGQNMTGDLTSDKEKMARERRKRKQLERVRQVEKQAMDKLQAMGTSMGLEDFLE